MVLIFPNLSLNLERNGRIKMKNNSNGINNKKTKQLSFEEFWNEFDTVDKRVAKEIEIDSIKKDAKGKELFPVNLVKDFDQFIDYIQNHTVQLTKTMEYIARKHLPMINERMSVKNNNATSYTEQEYYPYIHFFYSLALCGGLFEKVQVKAGKRQLMETERLHLFTELTDIEKYFFLLETFWVDVNWANLLDKSYNTISLSLQDLFYFLSQKNPGFTIYLDRSSGILDEDLSYRLDDWNYFLLYFEWLGLWECEANQELLDSYGGKSRYFAKSIQLTNFGSKIMPTLLLLRNLNIWNIAMRRENGEVNPIPGAELEDMLFGKLPQEWIDAIFEIMERDQSSEPFFLPFTDLFSKETLQRTLPRSKREFIDGIYTFRVSFTKQIWRKVVLTGKHTMGDLHTIILEAFNFDDDHLYSFFMDGKKWSNDCITSPNDTFGHPNAELVKIGKIGLSPKQRFLYLYDYGDEWTFTVEVEHIEEIDSVQFEPFVKAEKGKAPLQYGDY